MPRLSVIVPHVATESALEQTLVSLLEHRDASIEVIVADAGQYADPYGLDGDEIRIVSTDDESPVGLLNHAFDCARATVIQTLMPGTTVTENWYQDVLPAFEDCNVAAVAAAISTVESKTIVGLRASQLPRRQAVSDVETIEHVFPTINGGYISRKVLRMLGGLQPGLSLMVAETELALALQAMDVTVARYSEATMAADQILPASSDAGYNEGHMLGKVARAYANMELSPVKLDSIPVRMGRLAASLFNPINVAHRLGWTLGLQDNSLSNVLSSRVRKANDAWQEYLANVASGQLQRRAA